MWPKLLGLDQTGREPKMNIKANTTPLRIAAVASLIMLSTLFPGQADTTAPTETASIAIPN